MGPHPAVAEIRRAVRIALAGLESDEPVLVACSGGADSLALAAALAFEADRAGRRAGMITIDHGLQVGSREQAGRVADFGFELGLDPVELIPVEVGAVGGPEGAARAARYRALDATGGHVLLGHTLDDQAETVLLGLGRGSGPRSIAGMRSSDGRYHRPLLGVRRATTRAACHALGLQPWDDPHNADLSYQRVRLREQVLPLLEDVLQGGVADALARTATLLRGDLDALDALAAAALTEAHTEEATTSAGLAVDRLVGLVPAVRTRVLRLWARSLGAGPLNAAHVGRLDDLITNWHGQGRIQLPGGYDVERVSGTLLRVPGAKSANPASPDPARSAGQE